MSREHPELIFVRGPQAGQRVALSQRVLVLGRGGDADIMLSEDFASRRQARYELSPDGPGFENLSSRGTWINGKRFKAGKRVLLDTGDLIGVGKETEVLYVAAGDDGDAALAAYEASATMRRNAFGKRPKPSPKPAAAPPDEAAPEAAAAIPAEEEPPPAQRKAFRKRPSEMTAGERVTAQEGARRRKILIMLGAYFAVNLVVAIVLKVLTASKKAAYPMPEMFQAEQVRKLLGEVPQKRANPARMRQRLVEAMNMHRQYSPRPAKLYTCVLAFQDALAYSGNSFFQDRPNHDAYQDALGKLSKGVWAIYKNGCLYEREKEWEKAEAALGELLAILAQGPKDSKLFRNVQDHQKRVKHFYSLEKPRQGGQGR